MNALRLLAVLFALAIAAQAEEKVWSAVILASDPPRGEKPKAPPADIAPYAAKLTKVFGYEQFEIIGSATKAMDNQTERWLVPSQNFWVGAFAKRAADGYLLKLEFFHDKRKIVETQAKLGSGTPLFIRGPVHARGQLIVVFEVRQ
jgi:hypothetical protein